MIAALAQLPNPSGWAAEDAPRPPCGTAPNPSYAAGGAQPSVRIWNGNRQGISIPSSCHGLSAVNANVVLALAGTFRFDGSADEMLERIGAVSAMRGIRYWSVTDRNWRELITQSAAVEGPKAAQRRADFTAAELKRGKDVYFVQHDSRSTGEVVYRMRVLEATASRLVVETENLSPIRTYIFTVFGPRDLRTIQFLTRPSPGLWNSYVLTLVGAPQSESHMASLVNRAAALYRHAAGQRTDDEPPLAP